MNELIGQPLPPDAEFMYLSDTDPMWEVYRYLTVFLLTNRVFYQDQERKVYQVIEDENSLPDPDPTGGVY